MMGTATRALVIMAALSSSLAAEPGTPATAMQGDHATVIFQDNLYNGPSSSRKTTVLFLRELADHMQGIYKAAFQASYLEEFMHESIGYHGTSNPQNSVLHDDMNYANAFKHFPITDICARGLAVLLSNKFTDMSSTTYSVGGAVGRWFTANHERTWRTFKGPTATHEDDKTCSKTAQTILIGSLHQCKSAACYDFVTQWRDLVCVLLSAPHNGNFQSFWWDKHALAFNDFLSFPEQTP